MTGTTAVLGTLCHAVLCRALAPGVHSRMVQWPRAWHGLLQCLLLCAMTANTWCSQVDLDLIDQLLQFVCREGRFR